MTTSIKVNRKEAEQQLAKGNSTILLGSPGVGKTTIVRKPRMVTTRKIAEVYNQHGYDAVKGLINNQIQYQNLTVVIDDLGVEDDVKHYTNKLDPVASVILGIYEINQVAEKPITLLLTTNLNKDELIEKYGIRVVDRIWEMCDRLVIDDVNLRI